MWRIRERNRMQVKRYQRLDSIRGITLFSMILFHTVWDLVYIFKVDWEWFYTDLAHIWQQSICWTFIALSGFCWPLGRRKLRRGLLVFGAGLLISLVTEIFVPDQRIRFGVLTLLGTASLLLIVLEKWLKKVSAWGGFVFCCIVFGLFYGVNDGYIGIKKYLEISLPDALYGLGDFGTFMGFKDKSFYSTDYFSLLPWIFLFLGGYFLYRIADSNGGLLKLAEQKTWGAFWDMLGRKSLIIYMLHQPVIYGVLLGLDKLQII